MTLTRTREPAASDPAAEASLYHEMDHEAANQAFVTDLIAGGSVGPRGIDLGCGPADIPILLCELVESVEVLGIDAEVEMLELAKREIDMAGMLYRISLQHTDVVDMTQYEDGLVDTVISNSLLHHLDDPTTALATAKRLAKPGGRLFVRDLVRPSSHGQVEQHVATYAANESTEAQQLFRQSFLAALTLDEIKNIAGGLGIDPQCVQMTSDRHWTIDWSKVL